MTSTTVTAVNAADTVVEAVKPINPKVQEILESYKNPYISFSHNCLVERVTKHPVLENWIKQKIESNPKIINLISNDWLSVLENNLTFQEYMNGKVQYYKYDSTTNTKIVNYKIQSYTNNFNVIAVGTFKVTKDNNKDTVRLKLVECIPVQCIAEIMCLQLEKEVFSNAKFFIKTCNGFCIKCRKNNVASDNIWCIQRSMVYENDKIQYAERKYCTSLYPNEFKAIIHLELNCAYTFKTGCKIGGTVESIVFIESIFDFNDNNSVQGILKTDENFVPREENANNGQLKSDEKFIPHQETGIKRIIETENENSNIKHFKNENEDHGINQKNEDDNKTFFKNMEAKVDILAIPQGTNYTKPQGKSFEVKSTIEKMPDIV